MNYMELQSLTREIGVGFQGVGQSRVLFYCKLLNYRCVQSDVDEL